MAYTKTILPQNEGKEIKNEDKSKYEKALELYDTNLNDAEVQAAVKKIIEKKVPQNDTMEVNSSSEVSNSQRSVLRTQKRKCSK